MQYTDLFICNENILIGNNYFDNEVQRINKATYMFVNNNAMEVQIRLKFFIEITKKSINN